MTVKGCAPSTEIEACLSIRVRGMGMEEDIRASPACVCMACERHVPSHGRALNQRLTGLSGPGSLGPLSKSAVRAEAGLVSLLSIRAASARPCAASRELIHCARETPGTRPRRSLTSQ